MCPRERVLSALFGAVIALPVVEAVWRLDDWPASRVAMFSRRVSPTTPVHRIRLVGTNARGEVIELRSIDVGLDPTQFNRRLPPQGAPLAAACGALGRLYNQRNRLARRRLTALHAEVTVVPRPGMPPPIPASWTVDCALGSG